jgi:hypothetical protein
MKVNLVLNPNHGRQKPRTKTQNVQDICLSKTLLWEHETRITWGKLSLFIHYYRPSSRKNIAKYLLKSQGIFFASF